MGGMHEHTALLGSFQTSALRMPSAHGVIDRRSTAGIAAAAHGLHVQGAAVIAVVVLGRATAAIGAGERGGMHKFALADCSGDGAMREVLRRVRRPALGAPEPIRAASGHLCLSALAAHEPAEDSDGACHSDTRLCFAPQLGLRLLVQSAQPQPQIEPGLVRPAAEKFADGRLAAVARLGNLRLRVASTLEVGND